MASAISFVVYLPAKGFANVLPPGNFCITESNGTISIPVCGELTALFAISSLSQKNPLPPAC